MAPAHIVPRPSLNFANLANLATFATFARLPNLAIIAIFAAILLLPPVPAGASASGGDLDQAALLERRGDAAGAIAAYHRFIEAHPDDRLVPVALFAASTLEAEARHDLDAALQGFDRLLAEHSSSPWAPDAACRKAEALAAAGRWSDAGTAYARALALAGAIDPANSGRWTEEVAGRTEECFQKAGDPEGATRAYAGILAQPLPAHVAALLHLRRGSREEASGREAEAAESYARIIRDYPYTEVFERAIAQRELLARHQRLPGSLHFVYARAGQDMRQGAYASARDRADSVLRGQPDPPLAVAAEGRRLVCGMLADGEIAAGLPHLEAFAQEHPEYGGLPNVQRLTLFLRAITEAEKGAQENPDDPSGWHALGEYYLQGRLFRPAVGALQRAWALDPADLSVNLLLGTALVRTGETARADSILGAVAATHANNPRVLNQAAYALLQNGLAAQALPFFERYAEVAPDDPNAHDSLGEGLIGVQRFDEARREYERALELDPAFANSQFMLGQVCRQLGDLEAAVAAYRRYLELQPGGSQAAAAQQALHEIEDAGGTDGNGPASPADGAGGGGR